MAITHQTSRFHKTGYDVGYEGAVLGDGAVTKDVGQVWRHTVTVKPGTATTGTVTVSGVSVGGGASDITSGAIDLSTDDLSLVFEGVFSQLVFTPATTDGTFSVFGTGSN